MFYPYRDIFRAPGTVGFASAGFIARLPLAMVPMGLVAMLSQTHGEYWLAGAVSATFALTNALVSPRISRLVDRHGQAHVLIPATIVALTAFILLLAATTWRWSSALLFLFAALAGVMPSMPAMIRARWTEIYRDTPKLSTAFAFESVSDEILYMTGSVLSIGLSVGLFPEAGPLFATVFLAVGTFLFVIQKKTEPRIHAVAQSGAASVIAFRPLQLITFVLLALGTLLGTAEVAVIALTKELGQPGAASFVLAGYAGGSLVVGLVFGVLKLKANLAQQFVFATLIAALTALPLPFITNIPMLGLALFIAGAAVSPSFITAFGLIEQSIPVARLTEGMTWAMTGIGIGMAAGSFSAGYVVDAYGPASGFWVSVTAGVLALAAVTAGYRMLADRTRNICATPIQMACD
ncbi:MFS transporter [Aestuariivirga sp. YIM B02566]|uniref:MFS transporter n=1 Tax=Taklimakanibacter albus TaxID=2800327 RepID=A0ACC5RBZ8_9HYPH|nr:MFS transporter [Aestuariivirga sp. YIM B02566]MBK1870138.1 MFS transporter [Aestuariivirga sp. YIM B02566]